jgi:hypothetical protein
MSSQDVVIDMVISKQRNGQEETKTGRKEFIIRPVRMLAIWVYINLSSLACLTAVLRLFTPSLE